MFPLVNKNIANAPTNNITIIPSTFGWNSVAVTSSPKLDGSELLVVVVVVV